MKFSKKLFVALGLFFLNTNSSHASSILSFYPTGAVKNIQQVTVHFSDDMIAMGSPKSKIDPFIITCNKPSRKVDESGQAVVSTSVETPHYTTRWADSKNWSLDFEKPLKSGLSCHFKMRENTKDLSGAVVSSLAEYNFSTSGLEVLDIYPSYGDIEPEQYIVARINGALDLKSLEAIAYFEVQGLSEKVGVRVIQGKEREDALKVSLKDNWNWYSYDQLLKQKPERAFSKIKEMEDFIVITGVRRFPENAKVILHWPKGILSKTGVQVEDPQNFDFKVINDFKATFTCQREKPESACNPLLDVAVHFSRSVNLKSLAGAQLVSESGKIWIPEEFKTEKRSEVMNLTFKAPFPSATQFKVILPLKIVDEIGRPLSNQQKYPLKVATDEASPLIKFPAAFGVLELKGEPLLPVTVRNIESSMSLQQVGIDGKTLNVSGVDRLSEIISWYQKVSRKADVYSQRGQAVLSADQGQKFKMPKPLGEKEFEVVGIPLKKPGFYVIEFASPKLGEALLDISSPMYVATSALVTDMAVHFKKGQESSVIWVTQLSNAKPVASARVSVLNALGKLIVQGVTNNDGILSLEKTDFKCIESPIKDDYGFDGCEFFAFAQKGDDISFASTHWNKGIEPYRFNVSQDSESQDWGPALAHTILNRMAVQPGETIQMKHVLREHHAQGFSMLHSEILPKRVLVIHQGSQKTYTLPFNFDKSTGTATGKWTIPKDATLGRYSIYLSNRKEDSKNPETANEFDWSAKETGYFILAEYRIPLMKAFVKTQGKNLISPLEVKVDLSAQYLAGGPAKGLKVKLRASYEPGRFIPQTPNASDYRFFSSPLKAGITDSENREESSDSFLQVQDLVLGADGGLLTTVKNLPKVQKVQNLLIEMEYTDPNGEVKTTVTTTPIFPSSTMIGLRSDNWYSESGKTKVFGLITDNLGQLKKNQSYIVEAFQTQYITHRKRLVGGFYSYDSKNEVIALGKVCEGHSDEQGRFSCQPQKLPSGSITLQAKTTDEKNNTTYASVPLTVFEENQQVWWNPTDSDRIDLIPEKMMYEPNEKAKIIVRSPYPVSTVLVTVEREGVLDSFVKEIQRDNTAIEVPLKGSYAPNVFVSALVLRGRVGDQKPTALLDLGKPAMKMGLVGINVGWKAHELLVEVKSEKKKYQAREKAQVTIQVKSALGTKLPAGSEVAIVAVDEGLLRLHENTSVNILKAMMGERNLAVETSSGQNQVIGRRHFGSKAKAPGGSGGSLAADARELFDPVLIWEPKIKLNAEGEAKVIVPLNDSTTSFKITAVAIGGENLFGDGSTTIESTKDLIIYSGFAPLVREGDQIKNAFTVRNTTSKKMKVQFDITSKEIPNLIKLNPIELDPSQSKTLDLPIVVPSDLKEIRFQIHAKNILGESQDILIAKIKVIPSVPARVMQSTLFQLDKSNQIPVQQPVNAIAGRGGLSVQASASLASNLNGVKSYMEKYPYSCLEQQISKAIVLDDKNEIKRIIEQLPTYLDSYGLLKFFPSSLCGSSQLTRYILNILSENKYEIPKTTVDQMVAGLTSVIEGKYSCEVWWDNLSRNNYRTEEKVLLMESLSRYKALNPSFLTTIEITPRLWKTETVVAWFQLLKREINTPNRGAQLTLVDNILHSRLNFQGSIMNLQNSKLDNEAEWRLFTSQDQEALALLGVSIDEESWSKDVGRMARGVIARMRLGHWDTTMANAWGMTQLKKFSSKFEKEKISGETQIIASEQRALINWKTNPQGEKKNINWPQGSDKNKVNVQFTHSGSGKPWIHFETLSAAPLKSALDYGYKISRKLTPVMQAKAGEWRVGDVVNVELTITAKTDQPWVVVRDPIPAGAAHLGTGLAGSSNLLDKDTTALPSAGVENWPAEYIEKSQSHFVAYAGYLAQGTYKLNYRIRLNSEGDFKVSPTSVEAMYSPEIFGEIPNANWKVNP